MLVVVAHMLAIVYHELGGPSFATLVGLKRGSASNCCLLLPPMIAVLTTPFFRISPPDPASLNRSGPLISSEMSKLRENVKPAPSPVGLRRFSQLLLPPEHPRFSSLRLGFGNHPFFLI